MPQDVHARRFSPALRTLAAAALLVPALSQATSAPGVTAAITGVGGFCDLSLTAAPTNCRSGFSLTGTITLSVLGPVPQTGTLNADGSGPVIEGFGSDWVAATLQLQWTHPTLGAGSFNAAFVPTPDVSQTSAFIHDDYPYITNGGPQDLLQVSGNGVDIHSQSATEVSGVLNGFGLSRSTEDTGWLSGVNFDLQKGLAPASPNTQNQLGFSLVGFTGDPLTGQFTSIDPASYQGTFELTSWNVSAVPEPGTWALLGAGSLALLPLLRRRRTQRG